MRGVLLPCACDTHTSHLSKWVNPGVSMSGFYILFPNRTAFCVQKVECATLHTELQDPQLLFINSAGKGKILFSCIPGPSLLYLGFFQLQHNNPSTCQPDRKPVPEPKRQPHRALVLHPRPNGAIRRVCYSCVR